MLLLFKSAREAIRAEYLFKTDNITHRVIFVPREISSECGMAIELNNYSSDDINALVERLKLDAKLHNSKK